jgi:prophage regulatory protein
MATNDRIIRLSAVLSSTGLSRSTLYRKVADGSFPRPVAISVRATGWHESAVNRWIADPASYGLRHEQSRYSEQ